MFLFFVLFFIFGYCLNFFLVCMLARSRGNLIENRYRTRWQTRESDFAVLSVGDHVKFILKHVAIRMYRFATCSILDVPISVANLDPSLKSHVAQSNIQSKYGSK